MKIVVIGAGRMGEAFATAFVERTSHAVSIRGSHAGSSWAAALIRELGVRVGDDKDLLAADVVLVATPPAALDDVTTAMKGYARFIFSAMVAAPYTCHSSSKEKSLWITASTGWMMPRRGSRTIGKQRVTGESFRFSLQLAAWGFQQDNRE